MIYERQTVAPEEAHIAALVYLSRPYTGVLEILHAELELFPTTLAVLTGEVVTSDLQSKESLIETGTAVIRNLLVDQWSPNYELPVRVLMEGLWTIERWVNYRDIGGSENGLQHSHRDSHGVSLLCDLERKEGNNADKGFLFPVFFLHDMGEIGLGDTLYKDKSLSRERQEYENFCQLIGFLSPEEQDKWKYYYLGQYIRFDPEVNKERFENTIPSPLPILKELQEKYSYEGKIFDAAERIGYLLYAVHCFTDCYQIDPLIQVLRHQHQHLVRLSFELPSVGKYIYPQRVQSWAESLLERYEGFYLEE